MLRGALSPEPYSGVAVMEFKVADHNRDPNIKAPKRKGLLILVSRSCWF